jgi:hypothetical protein
MTAAAFNVFASLSVFSAFAILTLFATLTISIARGRALYIVLRRGRELSSRQRGFACAFNDLLKLAPVEPNAPAGRAHVALDIGAVERLHVRLAIRAGQERHMIVSGDEARPGPGKPGARRAQDRVRGRRAP